MFAGLGFALSQLSNEGGSMRGPQCGRRLQALVVASCLWASLSAASGEQRLERVTLSVEEPRLEHRAQVVRRGVAWVLPLRGVDPGRLVVKAGDRHLVECYLGWGEDERLRVGPLTEDSPLALPRVVNLGEEAPATQLKQIGEEEMLSTTKRLRAAFNLPEQLPRETRGGAP